MGGFTKVEIAGFKSCGFYKKAVKAAELLKAQKPEVQVVVNAKEDREAYKAWLAETKAGRAQALGAKAGEHTSSPYVLLDAAYAGGCDDLLAACKAQYPDVDVINPPPEPVSPLQKVVKALGGLALLICGKAKKPQIKPGAALPPVCVDQGFPPEKFNVAEFCKGKKVVLIGLPGAFTPTWSNKTVPGYLKEQAALKAKGVTDVLVYCVNDGAVMQAWAKDQNLAGSIVQCIADTRCELTEALGLVMDHPGPKAVLGTTRCKRFSMLIDNGVVKTVNVAEGPDDPSGDGDPTVSLVPKMLADL